MGSTLQLIDKGPLFEVFQGPLSTQRHDWTKTGAVRVIIVGYAGVENAEVAKARYNELQRPNTRWTKLYDMWQLTGYDPAFRGELLKFAQSHTTTTDSLHGLSRTKVMNMGVAMTAIALPGLTVKAYDKRVEFDVLCKKLGFPVNPPMPAPTGIGSGVDDT